MNCREGTKPMLSWETQKIDKKKLMHHSQVGTDGKKDVEEQTPRKRRELGMMGREKSTSLQMRKDKEGFVKKKENENRGRRVAQRHARAAVGKKEISLGNEKGVGDLKLGIEGCQVLDGKEYKSFSRFKKVNRRRFILWG